MGTRKLRRNGLGDDGGIYIYIYTFILRGVVGSPCLAPDVIVECLFGGISVVCLFVCLFSSQRTNSPTAGISFIIGDHQDKSILVRQMSVLHRRQ